MNILQKYKTSINMIEAKISKKLKSYIGMGTQGVPVKINGDIGGEYKTYYLVGDYYPNGKTRVVAVRDKIYIGAEFEFKVKGFNKYYPTHGAFMDVDNMTYDLVTGLHRGYDSTDIEKYDGISKDEFYKLLNDGKISTLKSYKVYHDIFEKLIGRSFNTVLHPKVYPTLKDRTFIPFFVYTPESSEKIIDYASVLSKGYSTSGRSRAGESIKSIVDVDDNNIYTAIECLPMHFWASVDLSSVKEVNDEYTLTYERR